MAKKSTYMPKPGYRASPLQQLSSKRNWDRLQIKGSTEQLRSQFLNSSMDGTTKSYWLGQLNGLEEVLTTAIDKKWNADKIAFELAVAAEAFSTVTIEKAPVTEKEGKVVVDVAFRNIDATQTEVQEAKNKIKAKRDKIAAAAKDF